LIVIGPSSVVGRRLSDHLMNLLVDLGEGLAVVGDARDFCLLALTSGFFRRTADPPWRD